MEKAMKYENAVTELEQIVAQLESGDMDLDADHHKTETCTSTCQILQRKPDKGGQRDSENIRRGGVILSQFACIYAEFNVILQGNRTKLL